MYVHKQRSCFGDRRYGIVASRQAPLHLSKGDYIGWLRNTSDKYVRHMLAGIELSAYDILTHLASGVFTMTPSLPALSAARPFPQRVRAKSPIAGDPPGRCNRPAARLVPDSRYPAGASAWHGPGRRRPAGFTGGGPPRSCSSTATSGRSSRTTASPATARTRTTARPICGWTSAKQAVEAKAIVPGNPDGSELVARIFSDDADDADAAARLAQETHAGSRRHCSNAGSPRAPSTRATGPTRRPSSRAVPAGVNGVDHLVQQRLGRSGAEAVARGRPPHAGPPAVLRPDRPAAHAGGGRGVRGRRCIRRRTRSLVERAAGLAALRRADGHRLAGRRSASPTRSATTPTTRGTCGRTATTSSRRSTRTSRSTSSPSSSWPATCCPAARRSRRSASCFNRLLLTTEEGGAQPKDYEARMLADRVRAVGTVWLGQTLGCCQCHDHKFDPAHDAGLLLAGRVLRRHPGADPRRPRAGHAAADRRATAELDARRRDRRCRSSRRRQPAGRRRRRGRRRWPHRRTAAAKPQAATDGRSAGGDPAIVKIEPAKRNDARRSRRPTYGRCPQLADLRTS